MKKNKYVILDLLNIPITIKKIFFIFFDVFLCFLSSWLAFYLRLGSFFNINDKILITFLVSILIAIPVFFIVGLYNNITRVFNYLTILFLFKCSVFFGLVYFTIVTIWGLPGVPRTIGVIHPVVLFFTLVLSRFSVFYLFNLEKKIKNKKQKKKNLLIYGAGDAGLQLSQAIFSQDYFYNLVGFIDDNKNLQGRKINSVPIYSIDEIEDLINTKNVSCILLAIPSLSRKRNNEILHLISKYPISYKTLPNLSDLPKGSVNINNIIDIDVSELLGRNQVDPNQYLLKKNIQNKVVMITGAGGSIGGELCKQIIKLNPKKILLIENNEFALYSIYSELLDMQDFSNNLNNISVTCFLASVQDTDTIEKIFNLHKPHSVYHAAAFKHVPILESNVIEAIKNNVFGSLNIINSSIKNKVENFVLISTDKAVKPTSIMGVTKRLSEICLQSIYRHYSSFDKSITKLSIVRFGNVVNSSGSVIPRFKKQISLGGPVTLTHPDVSRYFMSIQEASELVIQAGAMSIGCNVFVLDMGSPIKIINIINQLVSQAGLSVRDSNNPDGEIEIKLVGLRPGEKMHEELFLNDNKEKTEHPKIFKTQDSIINWKELSQYVDRLKVLVDNYKISEISDLLKELPLDFDIKKEFSDSLFLQVDEKVN